MNGRTLLVLDPGHGGEVLAGASSPNRGTGPNGLQEKMVALELARRTSDRLLQDVTVVLTREDDRNLSLSDRAATARNLGADLFVSIHLSGAADPTVNRSDVIVARSPSLRSTALAGEIQRRVAVVTGAAGTVLEADLGQLVTDRHDARTAACLVEVADITNPDQAVRLASSSYLDQLADALAAGIRAFAGAAAPVVPAPPPAEPLWAGAWRGRAFEAEPAVDPESIEGYEEESRLLTTSQAADSCTDTFCPTNPAEKAGTKHFSLAEFRCNDGTDVPTRFRGNVQALMENLEVVRAELGDRAITIVSGYRTCEYNSRLEGAASRSRHLCAQAADIRVADTKPLEVRDAIERLIAAGRVLEGGLGIYDTFVHYDIRGTRARWDRRRTTSAQSVTTGRRPSAGAAAIVTPEIDYRTAGLVDSARIWLQWLGRYAQWAIGVPDHALSTFPHAAICQLRLFDSAGSEAFGTGFYIGKETILTCGHNFWDSDGWETVNVEVQPGHSPRMSIFPSRTFAVTGRNLVHPRWRSGFDPGHDLAVLNVPGLPQQRGQFNLANMSLSPQAGIVVSGYGKVDDGTPYADQGQRMDGAHISDADFDLLYYPIQTIGGHSGSPVFHEMMVVGVHTGPRIRPDGSRHEHQNRAVLLTPDKNDWVVSQATSPVGSGLSLGGYGHERPNGNGGVHPTNGSRGLGLSYTRPMARFLADENSPQAEQSEEVRRRVARSLGQAEAGGRFDLVHDDSNRVNFGLGSWTGSRIADVLDRYVEVATENGTTATVYGYFGGQAAFEALRDRFRTQGTAATASAAERSALARLGADTTLQEAQVRHLAEDIRADLAAVGTDGNPWYPFIDAGMGAISEVAAHVLVHARHQAGPAGLRDVLHEAIDVFGGEAELSRQRIAGVATEIDFLGTVGERVAQRVQERYRQAVRNRYGNLIQAHRGSRLSYYFNPS